MAIRLDLKMQAQPDDASCGPTCLTAVYNYFGDGISLEEVASQIEPLETGGTLAVHLACHALKRGYEATIYTYNLALFDPTWFAPDIDIGAKMKAQAKAKRQPKLRAATAEYLRFFELGGKVGFEVLTGGLLRRYLARSIPLLTGLSSTYLYGCERESGDFVVEADDVGGHPAGHFVVLSGHNRRARKVQVADPWLEELAFNSHYYEVAVEHLIGAIMLGALTYDANLLALEPPAVKRDGRTPPA